MTTKELREKFELDLKELQDNCSHDESDWMPYMWAPGHFGNDVKVCKNCEKILETKCEKILETKDENPTTINLNRQ